MLLLKYKIDFTMYGNTFEEVMNNLGKLLTRCQEINLYLIHENFHVLLTEGIVFGHHISYRYSGRPHKSKSNLKTSNSHDP